MDFINTCFETTNEVRSLAHYSHLVSIFTACFLGYVVYRYATNRNKALIFTSFLALTSLWLIGDLVTWTSNNYYLVAAFWAPLDYINILFYLFIFCFVVFDLIKTRWVQIGSIVLSGVAAVLPFLITVSGTAVQEFDEPNCEMYGNELLAVYKLGFEWLIIVAILSISIIAALKNIHNRTELKRIAYTFLPTVAFLGIFSGSEFLSTQTEIYEITLYALFGLPILLLVFTFTIFEQHTFKFSLTNYLVVRLLFLIFIVIAIGNIFLIDSVEEFITTVASTIVTLGFALMLLLNARKETSQRMQIEKLAKDLESANTRLKQLDKLKSEFVSIASHQLRSPITAIRGYASLLLDGDFGKLPQKAMEPLQRIDESSKRMALSIEDYLNVSRIESGNMVYNYSDFSLRNEVEKLCDDMRPEAIKKGLGLIFRTSDLKGQGMVHADIGKAVQIVQNIINNAIKYTPNGSVSVYVRDDVVRKITYVDVVDTGVGIATDEFDTIFEKFERARNANAVNATGTGLGLYVAIKMAKEMGGDITVHSDGEGKGSRFTFSLPLVA